MEWINSTFIPTDNLEAVERLQILHSVIKKRLIVQNIDDLMSHFVRMLRLVSMKTPVGAPVSKRRLYTLFLKLSLLVGGGTRLSLKCFGRKVHHASLSNVHIAIRGSSLTGLPNVALSRGTDEAYGVASIDNDKSSIQT